MVQHGPYWPSYCIEPSQCGLYRHSQFDYNGPLLFEKGLFSLFVGRAEEFGRKVKGEVGESSDRIKHNCMFKVLTMLRLKHRTSSLNYPPKRRQPIL
jgi:hypothetical protein